MPAPSTVGEHASSGLTTTTTSGDDACAWTTSSENNTKLLKSGPGKHVILVCQLVLAIAVLAYSLQTISATGVATTAQPNSSAQSNGKASSKFDSINDTSLDPTDSGAGSLLLSSDEFVDYTEAPTLLFDATSNADSTTTQVPQNETTTTASGSNNTETTSTTSTPIVAATNATSQPDTATTSVPATTETNTTEAISISSGEEDEADDSAAGDEESLGSGGLVPDPSFEPPQSIPQYMDYIEKLFHDLRHQIAHLFEPHLPQLIRTSRSVELSSACSLDMLRMALALRQFEPWALRMIDSSGKLPEGIFEGSFTALGSYDQCLSVVFGMHSGQHNTGGPEQQQTTPPPQSTQLQPPTQGQYCLVTVSPFMPPKPPLDRVERAFQEEANRRNYSQDDQFTRLSPMFYYMKFRIGVCIPSTCEQADLDSISSALSANLRLNITIPDCRIKQANASLSQHQLVAGTIVACVLILVLSATLLDLLRQKSHKMRQRELELLGVVSGADDCMTLRQQDESLAVIKPFESHKVMAKDLVIRISTPKTGTLNDDDDDDGDDDDEVRTRQKQQHQQPQQQQQNNYHGVDQGYGPTSEQDQFLKRLSAHWAWLSFSLATSFRLYFRPARRAVHNSSAGGEGGLPFAAEPFNERYLSEQQPQVIIRCLDGIRVLSLCWVILANSYLTLDPRATKRLTKTREAPKDFVFQIVAQASLAIETFFFLSGLLMSLSFVRKFRSLIQNNRCKSFDATEKCRQQEPTLKWLQWIRFYVHRYIRMTPATMLIIAMSMYLYHFGDGPIWFEATKKAHDSCKQNWWRHMLHVANFIDTRQMCFIHYWYISADMQLFLFAPILMFLIMKYEYLGYTLMGLIGGSSVFTVFHTTYVRKLPPTLLFYSSDPESRREFGNTVMTKPLTHVLPYFVGMLVGQWLANRTGGWDIGAKSPVQDEVISIYSAATTTPTINDNALKMPQKSALNYLTPMGVVPSPSIRPSLGRSLSKNAANLFALLALLVGLTEVFLPYKWNNSHLPDRLTGAIYASLFRLSWSLVLAYVVISCGHARSSSCIRASSSFKRCKSCQRIRSSIDDEDNNGLAAPNSIGSTKIQQLNGRRAPSYCFCGSGGNLINRLLGLSAFAHLSRLSFVAYLIHLPLMSLFVQQTRGLFAFSHTLVIHLALSYLVMTFVLAFVLGHVIEFPFITFERLLFDKLLAIYQAHSRGGGSSIPRSNELATSYNRRQTGIAGLFGANTEGNSKCRYNVSLADSRHQVDRNQCMAASLRPPQRPLSAPSNANQQPNHHL